MTKVIDNLAAGSSPKMYYDVDITQGTRTATTAEYTVKVSAWLSSQTYDFYNADVYPKVKIGNQTCDFTLGTFPKGAGTKSSSKTVTVTGLSATTSSVSWTFSATTETGGSTGAVSSKTGSVACSIYLTTPSLSGSITVKDGTTTVSTYYRETIGTGSFSLDWPSATGSGGKITYDFEKSVEGGTWTNVSTLDSSSTSHAPGGATKYIRYRVRAINTAGSTNLYSGYIYSNTVYQNTMTAPVLTSSSSVSYKSTSLVITLTKATDKMGTDMDYTIQGINDSANHYYTAFTTAAGTNVAKAITPSTTSATTNITIRTNTTTSGTDIWITPTQLKTAALAGSTASNTSTYKANLHFKVIATNAYGTPKEDTISIPVDLGKDAPVSTTPSITIDSANSNYTISGGTYCIPKYKPINLDIGAAVTDALGRQCSFNIYYRVYGTTTDTYIRNLPVGTGLTAPSLTTNVSDVNLGMSTSAKTVFFTIKAKTYNGVMVKSDNTAAAFTTASSITANYYSPVTVTLNSLTRNETSANFNVKILRHSTVKIATANTVTLPSGWTKMTSPPESQPTGDTHTFSLQNTALASTYKGTLTVSAIDPVGTAIGAVKGNGSIAIPVFTPVLSVRQKGVGVNAVASGNGVLEIGTGIDSATGVYFKGSVAQGRIWTGNGGAVLQSLNTSNLHLGQNNTSDMVFYTDHIQVGKRMDFGATLNMGNYTIRQLGGLYFNDRATGGGEGLMFSKIDTTDSTDASDYDGFWIDNGTGYLNGKQIFSSDSRTLITSSGVYLHGTQSYTPTKTISKCPNGWVLVWSRYASGPQDDNWNFTFIPKEAVSLTQGYGISCPIWVSTNGYSIKYVYVTDTQVKGNDMNDDVPNNQACLRYVLSW